MFLTGFYFSFGFLELADFSPSNMEV